MKVFYLILFMVVMVNAQIPSLGKCGNITPKQDFIPAQYLGKWYEQEKYFAIFEFGGKCITADYSDQGNGVIGVLNTQLNVITNGQKTIQGTATLAGNPGEGKLAVVFPSVPFAGPAPYWVLNTDYTSYSVVYSCSEYLFLNTKIVWILTRDRNPSAAVMNLAYSTMDNFGLSRTLLTKTDQVNCPA